MNRGEPLTSKSDVQRSGRSGQRAIRPIAVLMVFVACTLAVASYLHLAGGVQGRSAPFSASGAGVAEAIIGAVLAAGAVVMLRAPARARAVGLAATGFATVGFLVGLLFTALGGHRPDLAYHLIVLPVLIGSLIVLLRGGEAGGASTNGGPG
jgi:hypothetical protein